MAARGRAARATLGVRGLPVAEFPVAEGPVAEGPERDRWVLCDRASGDRAGNPAGAMPIPDREVAFLHHHAACDSDLDDLIAPAGPPRARSEFEVRLEAGGCPSRTIAARNIPRGQS